MRRDDLLAGGLFAAAGVAAMGGAVGLRIGTPLHPQPGFFPFLGALCLSILALVLIVQACLERSTGGEGFGEVGRPVILVLAMGLYVVILESAGYVPATLLLCVVILRVLRVTSWRVLGVSSIALSLGTYLLFHRVLGIDLPASILAFLD